LRLFAKEQTIHNHSEGPDIKSGRLVEELEEERLRGNEGIVEAAVGEITSTIRLLGGRCSSSELLARRLAGALACPLVLSVVLKVEIDVGTGRHVAEVVDSTDSSDVT